MSRQAYRTSADLASYIRGSHDYTEMSNNSVEIEVSMGTRIFSAGVLMMLSMCKLEGDAVYLMADSAFSRSSPKQRQAFTVPRIHRGTVFCSVDVSPVEACREYFF